MEDQIRVANMLNCQVGGGLPMTYLVIPISDGHVGISGFGKMVDKMRRKLHAWKGKNMTLLGGRLILTNTSLSSLPIYIMGMYRLEEGIH